MKYDDKHTANHWNSMKRLIRTSHGVYLKEFISLGNFISIFFSYTLAARLKNYPSFLLLFRLTEPTNFECTFSFPTSIYCHKSLIVASVFLVYRSAKNSVK